jgi:FkbM family methyltransferase
MTAAGIEPSGAGELRTADREGAAEADRTDRDRALSGARRVSDTAAVGLRSHAGRAAVQVKKLIRTVQTEFPALADVKPRLQIRVGHLFRHPHERDFRLFRHLDIDAPLALDIGANRGQSLMSLWVTCREPRIIAFEPISGLAQKLRDSTPPGLVHVEQVALSHDLGEARIHIPVYNGYVYDGLASLSEDDARWLDGDRVYRYRPDKLEIVTETVEIRTLDSFDLDPKIVKIDVQGAERQVIEGGVRTIERSRPVLLVEAPSDDVVDLVAEFGYRPYAFTGRRLIEGALGDPNTFFLTDDHLRLLDRSLPIDRSVDQSSGDAPR